MSNTQPVVAAGEPGNTPLAWKLAQKAKLHAPSDGGVIAEFPLSDGGALYGEGNTSNAALRDLAEQLDRWGREA